MKKMQKSIEAKSVSDGKESDVPEVIYYGIIALKNNYLEDEHEPMD